MIQSRGLFRKCLSFFSRYKWHASLCPRAGLIDGLDLSPCIYNVNAVLELSRIKIATVMSHGNDERQNE